MSKHRRSRVMVQNALNFYTWHSRNDESLSRYCSIDIHLDTINVLFSGGEDLHLRKLCMLKVKEWH